MSNVTKLPEDNVELAKLRLQLRVLKAELRILTKEMRAIKAENSEFKKLNANLSQEIVKLNEVAALVPSLQEVVKRLADELEKCKKSKSHSRTLKDTGPHSWMGN